MKLGECAGRPRRWTVVQWSLIKAIMPPTMLFVRSWGATGCPFTGSNEAAFRLLNALFVEWQ